MLELEVRVTVIPEVGAIPESVTVPIAVVPPATALGETLTEESRVG